MPTEPGGRARIASGLFASGDAPAAPRLGAGLSDDPAENRISLIYRAYKDVTPDDAAQTALLAQSFGTSFEFAPPDHLRPTRLSFRAIMMTHP